MDKAVKEKLADDAVAKVRERVVQFLDSFESSTAGPQEFASMSQLEDMLGSLVDDTRETCCALFSECLGNVDDKELVKAKKAPMLERG